ncbi:MAG: dihydropteroate synthase [Candidatus Zixiibacteriota bacterium]
MPIKTDKFKKLILPGNRFLDLEKPAIMGILNLTPDSFSDGGKHDDPITGLERARQMISEGADIIDIGGESSRPGSEPVSANNELGRVLPVIKKIREFSNIPISIDTTKAVVARESLLGGADIINDISAMRFDKQMVPVAKEFEVPIILMHMLGSPKTMQKDPSYENCLEEIIQFFRERIDYCLSHGVSREKIIIDPGIGFGKRLEDNLNILKNLKSFNILNRPLLIGASRKSFIQMITGQDKPADKRIGGSLMALFYALRAGCNILRVHDVAETVEAVKVYGAIERIG